MPANFNWQTEKETDWTDELELVGETAVRHTRQRWVRLFIVTGLLLILAGLVVVWEINRRAKAVTQAIEDDIIASYELLLTAADDKDDDLFRSLHGTDGRSSGWGRSLDTLMTSNNQLLNGRRSGLLLVDDKPQVEEIVLTSDLTGAELITRQTYAIHAAVHVTETITLRQIYNYELQEDGRWLMIAPDADFWGNWQTYESQRLHLSYPARDETVTLQIIAALDENLEQLCRWSAEMPTLPPCPNDLQFQVRWRDEVDSLAAFDQSQSERILGTSLENIIIFLPAPTLVGIPVNEADEQVLIELYVQQTMATIIGKLQDSEEYDWYRFSGFNRASFNQFLVETGIAAWPPPAIPSSDPGPPPIPWPEQDIALTCLDESGQHMEIVRLQPENGTWSIEFGVEGMVSGQMLPGGRSFVQYWTGTEPSWAIIESDGTRFPVPAAEEPVDRMYRDGRFLVAPVRPPRQNGIPSQYFVLDWEQCLQGECHWHDVPGYPIFSPDESQLLLQAWRDNEGGSQILYGESLDGPFEFIVKGDGATWLDEATIGYRSMDAFDSLDAELVVAPVGGEPETVLTVADIEAVLPPKMANDSYWFYLVDVKSDLFLIHVTQFQSLSSSGPSSYSHFLLLFDRRSGEMTVVAEADRLNGEFAGNGRSLFIISSDSTDGIWSLDRYDIAQKRTETLIQYDTTAASTMPLNFAGGVVMDWSEDGQWLLVSRDGFLVLLAPDYNYKQVITPETPECFNVAWIEP